jgi:TonB-dependent receptor
MSKHHSTASGAVIAVALAWVSPVLAQTATTAETVDELVVTGQRYSQEKAIEAKRNATAVIDAISADDIGRLADKNVAENLERLPGVGIVYDQGEGRYVAIRGMDTQFNNVTLNGVEVGNPDGNDPRVPLDVVGGQLLGRIEVVKVVTSDMDGQGIGGAVNLVTQSPFDFKQNVFARGSAQVGYQDFNKKKTPLQGDATVGGIFGDGKWGALFGVNGSTRTFRSNGLFPDDWRAVAGSARGGLPTTLKYTNYSIKRERIGVSVALEFRPTDTDKFYLRGLYSKFTENEHRQRFRADFGANLANVAFNADGYTGTSANVDAREDLREEHKQKSIASVSVGGAHERGPWKADYDLSYGYDEVVEPNRLWQFRSVTPNAAVDFDMRPLLFTGNVRNLPTSNLGFRQYQEQDENGNETNYAAKFNLRRDIDVGDGGYIKAGVKVRDENKKFDGKLSVWDRASGANRFTLADFGLQGPNEAVEFDDRTYPMNYVIDSAAVTAFTDANLAGPKFVRNVATSLQNDVLNDFKLDQRIYAAYGMADVRFGQLRVIGGLRVERTETNVDGYRLSNGVAGPVSSSNDYTDVLPNLQLRFEPREDLVIRAAYSRTLGRPAFTQLKVSGTLTFTPSTGGQFEGDLSEGNVDLKPYISDNLDLTAEWYFAPGGLISAAAFHKQIKNPIYSFSETLSGVVIDGRTFSRLGYTQPRNADKGHISGIELGYQQQFTFLPGLLSGFGVAANATFTDSSVTVPGRGKADFQSQSDVLYGVQLFYQKGPVEAALSYHDTGKNLLTLGSTPLTDTYSDDYKRLDAKASYALNERVQVFAEMQNLTDEILRQYIGQRRDWITDYERLGRTYYMGVAFKW